MKAASTFIQIFALGACLSVHVLSVGEFEMAGVRRAIRTIADASSHPITVSAEAPTAMEGAGLDG